MGKFGGIVICTDLDGTLFRNDKTVSAENKDAIEYFKSNGGFFTFVTGRMPFFIEGAYEAAKPNAPIGCINGGGLFDYENKKYIWHSTMPDCVTELIRCVDENFKDVGIQVNTFYKTYFCKENQTMKRFREITGLENLIGDYGNIKEPIAKILFGAENEEEIIGMSKLLKSHPLAENFEFIRSSKSLFEILPKNIGKGTIIPHLCEYLKTDVNKTIAIGDYNNDISMFNAAKVGVAVANACPEALDAADYVTVSNEEHAIAKVIADLEMGKFF